jgi:hypothetical protein
VAGYRWNSFGDWEQVRIGLRHLYVVRVLLSELTDICTLKITGAAISADTWYRGLVATLRGTLKGV